MIITINEKTYKIKWFHINDKKGRKVCDRQTGCTVTNINDLTEQYASLTEVHQNDNYNYAFGRKLSLRRTMEKMPLTKEQRAQVWHEVFKKVKKQ